MEIQKLLSLVRQGIEAYQLIEEGDRIAVGVSGGKDSLTLLQLLLALLKFYPKKFDIMAITCDVGFGGMDFSKVQSWCDELGVKYEIVKTQIYDIAFKEKSNKRPCSLCAKLRKGAMYERLMELGYNKIAYAHNKDDFIETAFMSLIYEGRFYSFPPKTYLEGSGITVIRPMIYVPEKSIETFARENQLPVIHNRCPVDGSTKRAYAKGLVAKLVSENVGVKDKLMHAIESAEFDDWPVKIKK